FAVASARAQVGSTLRADLDALVERVGMASAAALSQDTAAASASLADARGLLPQLVTLARDPAAAQELGPLARRLAGRLGALQRVLEHAQAALDSPVPRARRRMRVERVSGTACGRSSTRLLFNYGPKAVNGLPPGFPANLPTGTYALSYAASGVVSIPETPLATLPNLGIHAFARAVVTAFQQVAAA